MNGLIEENITAEIRQEAGEFHTSIEHCLKSMAECADKGDSAGLSELCMKFNDYYREMVVKGKSPQVLDAYHMLYKSVFENTMQKLIPDSHLNPSA